MKAPSAYLAAIGRKGGKATGARKSRGSPEYYREIALKGWAKRKKPSSEPVS